VVQILCGCLVKLFPSSGGIRSESSEAFVTLALFVVNKNRQVNFLCRTTTIVEERLSWQTMQRKLLRDSLIKVAKEQVACDLAGEAVILSLKSGQYFGLNEVGTRIWNLIQEPKTVGAVLDAVLKEYDVALGELERDLFALLEQMVINDLIEVER
jgi:hypothetical protein